MKAIMISMRSEGVAQTLNGEKTIDIRKTIPKCELPVNVYIYVTQAEPCLRVYPFSLSTNFYQLTDDSFRALNGKVVAKFTLNKVEKVEPYKYWTSAWDYDLVYDDEILRKSRLTDDELENYICYSGYAWHINNLQIFDKPKELKDFSLKKAPQSWCYVYPMDND